MRLLDRADPRWVALMLVPVLLAAGAARTPEVTPGAALPAEVAAAGLPQLGDDVEPPAPVGVPGAPRREGRAARSVERRVDDLGPQRRSASLEQRGRSALRALRYDPASLGYRIRFVPARDGTLGTTNRRDRLITVHVRRGMSERVLRTTIAHELGHALDFAHGTSERRDTYRRLRGLPAGRWFPCDRCNDLSSPAGDFAEVFALWLAGPGDFRSRLAGPPTSAQLRELAPLFRGPAAEPPAPAAPTPGPTPTQDPPRGLPVLLDPPPTAAPERR